MAEYTTNGSDTNWSTTTAWTPEAPAGGPSNGDTAIANHNLDIDQDVTVGASLAGGNDAITIGAAVTLTLKAGNKLTLRGDMTSSILYGTPNFVMEEGSTLEFDSSQATDPTNQNYRVNQSASTYGLAIGITVSGSANNRCTIQSNASGGNGYVPSDNNNWFSDTVIQYCDLYDIGTSALPALYIPCGTAGNPRGLTLLHCVLDGCGEIPHKGNRIANATIRIENNKFINSVGTYCIDQILNGLDAGTGTLTITDNAFDLHCNLWSAIDFTVEGNIFANGVSTSTTAQLASFSNNLLSNNTDTMTLCVESSLSDCYYYKAEKVNDGNPHWFNIAGGSTVTVDGLIFEYGGSYADVTESGDIVMPAGSSAITVVVQNCIGLPCPANDDWGPGEMISLQGGALTTVKCLHNTNYERGMRVGESYNGHVGMLDECKSNITWCKSGQGYYKLRNQGTQEDIVLSQDLDYNCGFNLLSGSNGKGYENLTFSSGTPGDNDIDVDPQFADPTRNILTWDASLGGPGTAANAMAEMAKKNDPDFDSNYTVANLLAYVRSGFAPHNVSLSGTAHDGGDIGAVPVVTVGSTVTALNVAGSDSETFTWTEVSP